MTVLKKFTSCDLLNDLLMKIGNYMLYTYRNCVWSIGEGFFGKKNSTVSDIWKAKFYSWCDEKGLERSIRNFRSCKVWLILGWKVVVIQGLLFIIILINVTQLKHTHCYARLLGVIFYVFAYFVAHIRVCYPLHSKRKCVAFTGWM